ncbi:hypothetical protein J6590_057194 [Homalodisca vitripennis]|nr:hypothetical protein J6590_057194 [Homalodisca vitripennis]
MVDQLRSVVEGLRTAWRADCVGRARTSLYHSQYLTFNIHLGDSLSHVFLRALTLNKSRFNLVETSKEESKESSGGALRRVNLPGSKEERVSKVVYSFLEAASSSVRKGNRSPNLQGFLKRTKPRGVDNRSSEKASKSSFFEFLSQQRRVLLPICELQQDKRSERLRSSRFLPLGSKLREKTPGFFRQRPKRKASGKFPGTIFTTTCILTILFRIICSQSAIEYKQECWAVCSSNEPGSGTEWTKQRMTATLRRDGRGDVDMGGGRPPTPPPPTSTHTTTPYPPILL